ncbi:MAG: twin-arginine translocase TatA/TatE family subunit [Pirellulaceae bacterium]|nr:twin-arginine translocase TatA/TatE family subunit [Pirellulaceae bacterium]
MFGLGFQELMIVGVVAVLLFGKKLPEVARSLGTSYKEFKKGLTEIQSTMDQSDYAASNNQHSGSSAYDHDDYDEATAPKFEPPPAEPQEKSAG